MAPLIELCARRGFVYPGSSIYGGYASTFDYGPLGSQLKKNILDAWWKDFVELRPECVGLDTPIIINPAVWHASGHVEEFTDPLVQCNACNHRTRADKLLEDVYDVPPDTVAASINNGGMPALSAELSRVGATCPMCNSSDWGEPANFNLLFETAVGTAPMVPTATASNETNATEKGSEGNEGSDSGVSGGVGGGSHNSSNSNNHSTSTSSSTTSTTTSTTSTTSNTAYLRPETAQGAYINFANVMQSTRKRLPLGIGQIGKAFRNEISPGKSFLFRTREFELMELQWFIKDDPKDAKKWYLYWVKTCLQWLEKHGVDQTMVRAREHHTDEVAHYAKATTDIEFNFPGLGWGELWGIADRGTYDIEQHINTISEGSEPTTQGTEHVELSAKKQKKRQKKIDKRKKSHPLLYLDPTTGQRHVPRVIEPALGLTRVFLAVLSSAMHVESVPATEEGGEPTSRTVLRLHPRLAPVKVAVLPLLKNRSDLVELAEQVHVQLASRFACELDATGSIGKRYRKQDEIGTPLCVTVDVDSLSDDAATLRDRDSLRQVRLSLKEIENSSLDELLRHFE